LGTIRKEKAALFLFHASILGVGGEEKSREQARIEFRRLAFRGSGYDLSKATQGLTGYSNAFRGNVVSPETAVQKVRVKQGLKLRIEPSEPQIYERQERLKNVEL
jgi:hypothetical protein